MTDMTDSRHIDQLRILFPLADSLAMTLQLRKNGRITGQQTYGVEVGNHTIEFTAKVFASTVAKDSSSVLVKVRKRLWVYLDYDKPTDLLTLLIVDAAITNFHEDEATTKLVSGLTSIQFRNKYAKAIKAVFTRSVKEKGWVRNGDLSVDARQEATAGKGAAVPD